MTKDLYAYPPGIHDHPPGASKPSNEPIHYDVVGSVTKKGVTIEEGREHLINFVLTHKPNRTSYSILMNDNGSLNISDRTGNPCVGSLRTYGHKSLRPRDYFPGDLRTPDRTLPEGNPIMLAFPGGMWGRQLLPEQEMKETFLSSDGPWCSIVHAIEGIYKDGKCEGILVTDTNIFPTVMVNFIRKFRAQGTLNPSDHKNPRIRVLERIFGLGWMQNFGGRPDVARLIAGEVVPGLDEDTFYNRWPYNRPLIDYIFGYKADYGVSGDPEKAKPELY